MLKPAHNADGGSVTAAFALALLTFAVFAPCLGFDFVYYDDDLYILRNPWVLQGLTWRGLEWAFTTVYANYWLPLTWTSFMLDIEFWGVRAGGFHLTNILLHSANAALLFSLWRRMTGQFWPSIVLAALFAVHPLRIEAVAWIAQRKDVLSTLFLLIGFHQYLSFVEKRDHTSYAWLLIAALCGLLCKAMLVTLPLMLLLLDFWPLRRFASPFARSVKPLLLEKWPLFALSIAFAAATLLLHPIAEAPASLGSLFSRSAQGAVNYCSYLFKTIAPVGLTPLYPPRSAVDVSMAGTAILLLTVVTILAWVLARRGALWLAFGWLWFLGTLVPVIGLIQVGNTDTSDRLTYVAHIGLLAGAVFGSSSMISRRPGWRPFIVSAGVLLVVSCIGLTFAQLGFWRNGEALARHAFELYPNNPLAMNALANLYDRQGRLADGVKLAKRAINVAPDYVEARVTAASLLAKIGEYDSAVDHLRHALRVSPHNAAIHSQLGAVLFESGDRTEAARELRRAVEMAPQNLDARFNLAWALLNSGDARGAQEHLGVVLRGNPRDHAAWFALGQACHELNQEPEALRHYEQALRLNPGNSTYSLAVERARKDLATH